MPRLARGFNCNDTTAVLTGLKKLPEKALKDVSSQSLQQPLRNLDTAYNNFCNKRAYFPTFKRKERKPFRCHNTSA